MIDDLISMIESGFGQINDRLNTMATDLQSQGRSLAAMEERCVAHARDSEERREQIARLSSAVATAETEQIHITERVSTIWRTVAVIAAAAAGGAAMLTALSRIFHIGG